jgi:hypothetical protein
MSTKLASTHLTLPPVARGALMLLADLETAGARSDLSPVVVRLVRQELDRVQPGAWEAATDLDRSLRTKGLGGPKERASAISELLTRRLSIGAQADADVGLPEPTPTPRRGSPGRRRP